MGRHRSVQQARCAEHPGSHVTAAGKYEASAGTRQRYLCEPDADDRHKFSVTLDDGGRLTGSWSPPPACPERRPVGRTSAEWDLNDLVWRVPG